MASSDVTVTVSESVARELIVHAGVARDEQGCWVAPDGRRSAQADEVLKWALIAIAEAADLNTPNIDLLEINPASEVTVVPVGYLDADRETFRVMLDGDLVTAGLSAEEVETYAAELRRAISAQAEAVRLRDLADARVRPDDPALGPHDP